jgi:cell division protein FtsI (penicillin-binding protein 3)
VIAVSVDDPTGAQHYGGDVAGPVFSQVAAGALRAMGVQPDAPIVPMQMAQRTATPREDM